MNKVHWNSIKADGEVPDDYKITLKCTADAGQFYYDRSGI